MFPKFPPPLPSRQSHCSQAYNQHYFKREALTKFHSLMTKGTWIQLPSSPTSSNLLFVVFRNLKEYKMTSDSRPIAIALNLRLASFFSPAANQPDAGTDTFDAI